MWFTMLKITRGAFNLQRNIIAGVELGKTNTYFFIEQPIDAHILSIFRNGNFKWLSVNESQP